MCTDKALCLTVELGSPKNTESVFLFLYFPSESEHGKGKRAVELHKSLVIYNYHILSHGTIDIWERDIWRAQIGDRK